MALFNFSKWPKRQLIIWGTSLFVLLIIVGVFIWAILTGRIRPFAAVTGQVQSYSTITYDGLTTAIKSNTVITDIIVNPPSAPSNLTATAASSSQINLSWADNSTDETGFKIERATPTCASGFAQIATLGVNVTTYQNTGLTASTAYCYQVKSYNAGGDSLASNQASATTQSGVSVPAVPSNLSASAISSSQINLSWTDNATNEDGFKIERSLLATSGFAQIATVGANTATYQNTGLSASTTYYYRVRAYNTAGDSGYSNTANATTPAAATVPAAPTNLTGTIISSTQVNLTWVDNSNNEDGFLIQRATQNPTAPYTEIGRVGVNVTNFSDTAVPAAQYVFYIVKAFNGAGNSASSNTVTIIMPTPPAAPSNLTATAASSSQINLSWTDASTNESGFKIERATPTCSSGFTQITTVGAGVTSYQNTGLTASTNYCYQVRAYNSGGNSAYSNQAQATTSGVVDNLPAISIDSPANGATVSGTVSINATATDDKGVGKVAFYIDSVWKADDTVAPYSWSWDTTSYTNGSHTIMARAYDTINQYTDKQITVTVNNASTQVVVSNVIVSTTATTATVNWVTNIVATSQVCYGVTPSYGTCTPVDSALVTSHSVTITGLAKRTTYYYQIISIAGTTGTYSGSFKTKNR